tara:strand:- start:2156 stop:2326 length:171 start_codon:yes stop_codon:yes gene_type:complete
LGLFRFTGKLFSDSFEAGFYVKADLGSKEAQELGLCVVGDLLYGIETGFSQVGLIP